MLDFSDGGGGGCGGGLYTNPLAELMSEYMFGGTSDINVLLNCVGGLKYN